MGNVARSSLLVLVVVCVAFGCKKGSSGGNGGNGGSGGSGGSGGKGAVPKMHRGSAEKCSDAPRKDHVPPTLAGDCKADADCTQGKNGLCVSKYIGQGESRAECAYDECFQDGDCKSGPCICGVNGNHVCAGGTCRTDADCKGSFCSPSLDDCGWDYEPPQWFCHGPDDDCTNDDECGPNQQGWCGHDAKSTRWVCRSERCQD